MQEQVVEYSIVIKEVYLDVFGHMNNATYLSLFDEARWDLITNRGYGLAKIQATGLGPVVLEIKVNYLKEIMCRDEIIIRTELLSYKRKIGLIKHTMLRGTEVCATAEVTFGLFSLSERKLVLPTPEWLFAIGANQSQ